MTEIARALPRLHIVDPNPAVHRALLQGLEKAHVPFTTATVSAQWLAMHEWDFEPSTVVVRAAIRDVWPVLLKVRALCELRCRTIVLLDCAAYPAARARLLAEGATAVVDSESGLTALVDAVATALQSEGLPPRPLTDAPAPVLPDRSLQVAALFTSVFAPTTTQIGYALGLSPETVRTHLQLVRNAYRAAGNSAGKTFDISSRQALRETLRRDGQTVGETGWYE